MTNKEAINNLEELYPVVSEEKKQAIDKAIKALKRVDCIYVKDECFAACGDSGTCEAEEGETDGEQ